MEQRQSAAASVASSVASSPQKSFANLSSSALHKANQSVDDFLRGMDIDSQMDISLPDLSQQGDMTLPLNVESSANASTGLTGPRKFVDSSPTKKKSVKMDMTNTQYYSQEENESGGEGDESNNISAGGDDDDHVSIPLETAWQKVSPGQQPWNDQSIKPLPKITNSNSMPNLDYYASSDSEKTVVPSPVPHSEMSFKKPNMSVFIPQPEQQQEPIMVNKMTYDHAHYIQDLQEGNYSNLVEARKDFDLLKKDIALLPDLTPISEVKQNELIEAFEEKSELKRHDSGKSIISIKETLLETKKVVENQPLLKIELSNETFQKDDDIVERTFDDINANNNIIIENDDDASGQVTLSNNAEIEETTVTKLNLPKNQHKRTSSLSEMVGSFIRSISSKSIDKMQSDEPVNMKDVEFIKRTNGGVAPSRIISGVSVATTTTEGFVSAQEDFDPAAQPTYYDNQSENKGSVDVSDVDNQTDEGDMTVITIKDTPENNEQEYTEEIVNIPAAEHAVETKIKTNSNTTPNSSFNSDKFVLKASFDDDVYSNEFDDFNKSLNFKSRISSTSTQISEHKRIQSFEITERNEVLDIWNKQPSLTPKMESIDEFDSINSPIKSVITSARKAREIRDSKQMLSRKTSRKSSSDLLPSNWVLNNIEVYPTKFGHRSNKSSIHTIDKLIVNPLFSSTDAGINKQMAKELEADLSTGTIIHNNSDLNPDYLAIKFEDSLYDHSELLNAELSTGLSDMEDSLLKVINQWDPVEEATKPKGNTVSHNKSNSKILTNVWNNDGLDISSGIPSSNVTANPLDDFENFLQDKRIISDSDGDFKVKSAQTGKVHYHMIKAGKEQNGLIMNLDNISYSKLIPELGITQTPMSGLGIQESSKAKINTDVDDSMDSFKTANSMILLATPKKSNMADAMRPNLSPTKADPLQLSPAHKKMQAKMNQQIQMRAEQEKHKKLQLQLQRNLREEAKVLAEMYPKKPISPVIVQNEELFEDFGNATSPLNDNPFEASPVKPTFVSMIPPAQQNNISPIKKIIDVKSKLIDGERGRLFFKVNSIGDLKLPNFQNRNAKLQMVFDNGIHRLITDYISLRSGLFTIGKEFELIVAEKLDIVITLKLKYDKSQPQRYTVAEKKSVKSKSKIGRLFGRKEIQIVNKEVVKQPQHDSLSDWIANDGSFAKLKLDFDDFEKGITGELKSFNLKCFNEWKSFTNANGKLQQVKTPLEVCTINLQMLFVPRTLSSEVLPISISNAMEQVEELKKINTQLQYEGFLYQEGGDLDVWTRRYYKLDGYDLLAFSDMDGKLKAKINLKKVSKVYTGSSSTERKFSDSLKLNNEFKVQFSNNEVIEFGCDSKDQAGDWIQILNDLIVLKDFQRQPWIKLMSQKTMKNLH